MVSPSASRREASSDSPESLAPAAAGANEKLIAGRAPSGPSAISRPASRRRIPCPQSASSFPAVSSRTASGISTSRFTTCPVERSSHSASPTAPRSGHTPTWRVTSSESSPETSARRDSSAAASASASDSAFGTPNSVTTSLAGRSAATADGTELTFASTGDCPWRSSNFTNTSIRGPPSKERWTNHCKKRSHLYYLCDKPFVTASATVAPCVTSRRPQLPFVLNQDAGDDVYGVHDLPGACLDRKSTRLNSSH